MPKYRVTLRNGQTYEVTAESADEAKRDVSFRVLGIAPTRGFTRVTKRELGNPKVKEIS